MFRVKLYNLLINWLTNSTESNRSSEAKSHTSRQEIPSFYGPAVHYRV